MITKTELDELASKYDTKEFPNSTNWIITLSFLIVSTCIASLYQSISDYISLIGSFCSVVIAMLIPGLCYIKGNDYKISHWKNVMTIILVIIFFNSNFSISFNKHRKQCHR